MKVEIKELENNQKTLAIEIPEEIVTEKINEAYRQINASTTLKGFRPGKIPRNILKMYFWKKIKSQAINNLVPDYFQRAIDERKLRLIGQPEFEGEFELKEKAPFSFKVIVTTWPRIDLPPNYKEIEIIKEKTEVTEEKVDNVLKELQNQQATYRVVVDRSVKQGDQVVVDYTSWDAEKESLIEEKQDAVIEVSLDQSLPALCENLLGMNKGEEKEFEETFPEDFFDKKLANQKIRFKITVKEIKEKILPEINEDFAKDLGDYTLESLKAEVTENLKKRFEEEAQDKMKGSLFDTLLALTSVEPPEIMIENEIESMIRKIEIQLAGQGKELEKTESKFGKLKAGLRESAVKRVKISLILYEVACREGIVVTDEEIDHQAQQLAKMYRESVEEIKKSWKSELEKNLREQKTVNFLIEQVVIK